MDIKILNFTSLQKTLFKLDHVHRIPVDTSPKGPAFHHYTRCLWKAKVETSL